MAGTRAMNGEASRATTAISSMAERQPGSAAAARAPAASRAPMPVRLRGQHRLGQSDHDQGDHHGGEGGGVDAEHQAVVVGQERQAGEGRSDHPPQVELGRRQGHRTEEVLVRDQVGDHGLEGREPDGARGPAEEGQHHQHRRRVVARGGQDGQDGGETHLGQRGDDQPPSPVEAIGHDAAQGGEESDRDEGGRSHQAGPGRLVGPGEDQHAEGHRLHPRSDVGDQGRRPDEGEVPRAKRAQRGQGHRVRLPAVRSRRAGPGRIGFRGGLLVVLVLATGPQGEPPDARHGGEHAEGRGGFRNLARTIRHAGDVTWPWAAVGPDRPRAVRRPPPRRGGGRSGPAMTASTSWPGPAAP